MKQKYVKHQNISVYYISISISVFENKISCYAFKDSILLFY